MIIEFTVKNSRSIRDRQVLSLVADTGSPEKSVCTHASFFAGGFNVVNSAIICGPNASGKTNILHALFDLRSLVLNSGKFQIDDGIHTYRPFRLDEEFEKAPIEMSIEFVADDLYEKSLLRRYCYEVSFSKDAILRENLNIYVSSRASLIYERVHNMPVKRGAYYKAKTAGITNSMLDNQLYLSVAGNAKDNPLNSLYRFFRDGIRFVPHEVGTELTSSMTYPSQLRGEQAEYYVKSLGALLKAIDTGIQGIKLEKKKIQKLKLPNGLPKKIKDAILNDFSIRPVATHTKFKQGVECGAVDFDISVESEGSQHFFNLAADVLDALRDGSTLIVDELHEGLHPDVSKFIIQMFQCKDLNHRNAQLIFSSHDLLLLSPDLFGRDQVWFTEKDHFGMTHLYSLLEFNKSHVRANTNYYQWYINGKFGALPSIDFSVFSKLILHKDSKHASSTNKK